MLLAIGYNHLNFCAGRIATIWGHGAKKCGITLFDQFAYSIEATVKDIYVLSILYVTK